MIELTVLGIEGGVLFGAGDVYNWVVEGDAAIFVDVGVVIIHNEVNYFDIFTDMQLKYNFLNSVLIGNVEIVRVIPVSGVVV